MVSNVLNLSSEELASKLAQFRVTYAEDPEYQELRKQFPADWPM